VDKAESSPDGTRKKDIKWASRLLELLLGSELGRVSALPLPL
jgi:hypothetical protein